MCDLPGEPTFGLIRFERCQRPSRACCIWTASGRSALACGAEMTGRPDAMQDCHSVTLWKSSSASQRKRRCRCKFKGRRVRLRACSLRVIYARLLTRPYLLARESHHLRWPLIQCTGGGKNFVCAAQHNCGRWKVRQTLEDGAQMRVLSRSFLCGPAWAKAPASL